MKCIQCDGRMVRGPVSLSGVYRGFGLSVEMPDGWQCESCHHVTIHGRDSAEFGQRLRQKYQEAQSLVPAAEVREIRASVNKSQVEFAQMLGVGVASVKRMEQRGCLNALSNQMLRIVQNPSAAEDIAWESIAARVIDVGAARLCSEQWSGLIGAINSIELPSHVTTWTATASLDIFGGAIHPPTSPDTLGKRRRNTYRARHEKESGRESEPGFDDFTAALVA